MKSLIFCLLLLPQVFVRAQQVNDFIQINEQNGLLNNHIENIVADKKGTIWVTSKNGVSNINGSEITNWEVGSIDAARPRINHIAIDNENTVFIADYHGIYCLRPNSIKWIKIISVKDAGFSNLIIQGDQLWVGSNNGVCIINTKTLSIKYLNTEKSNYAIGRVTRIGVETQGRIWISTKNALYVYSIAANKYTKIIQLSDTSFLGLVIDIKQLSTHCWLINSWSKYPIVINKEKGRYHFYRLPVSKNIQYDQINVYQLNDGLLHIQNGNEYYVYDSVKNIFRTDNVNKLCGKITATSSAVINDQAKIILGTKENGILITNISPSVFNYQSIASTKDITSQGISLFHRNNNLYIGAEGRFFLQSININQLFAAKQPFAKKIAAIPYTFLGIQQVNNNLFDIATANGILQANIETGVTRVVSNSPAEVVNSFITHIYKDSYNQYWVFPWRMGIWQTDTGWENLHLVKRNFISRNKMPKPLVIAHSMEDANHNLWMADLDEGLIKYDRRTKEFSKPLYHLLGDFHVHKILMKADSIWFVYNDDKLIVYDTKRNTVSQFIIPESFRKEYFDEIILKDKIWMLSSSGLVLYNMYTNKFRKFTTQDGLPKNNLSGTIYAISDTQIVIAHEHFLTYFNPILASASNAMPVSVQLNYLQTSSGLIANPIKAKQDSFYYKVPHDQNNITIKWVLPDFSAPLNNMYYYTNTSNKKDSSIYVGNSGVLNLTALSSGKYELILWASNANGVLSKNQIHLFITIKPPFWLSWWFVVGCLLILGAIVSMGVRNRIRNIRYNANQKAQLAQLEMKALKAQMNPHFVFNSLSSIQESIINGKTSAATKYLNKFSKLIRMVLEQSEYKTTTLTNELDYLNLYLELESFRFEDFTYEIKLALINDPVFINIPFMLIQPYIENAIKHGLYHKTGLKELIISITENTEDMLEVVIQDNGIGRDASAEINKKRGDAHASFGMRITDERLSLLNEKKAKTIIEDLYIDNISIGTRVTIYIPIDK